MENTANSYSLPVMFGLLSVYDLNVIVFSIDNQLNIK